MQAKNHMINNIKVSGSMNWTILTDISVVYWLKEEAFYSFESFGRYNN